jgi:hypothetical protein
MWQTDSKRGLETTGKDRLVNEIEQSLQGVSLMLVHCLTSWATGPLPPPAQIGQQ